MTVCPNCGHRIYDDSLTICPYCIEKVPTKKETEENALIKRLYKTTYSENDEVKRYLETVSILEIFCYLALVLVVLAYAIFFSYTYRVKPVALLATVVGIIVAVCCIRHFITYMRMIANMAQDMHTTALTNLLMLTRKSDGTNDNLNQTRLTKAEKQEFLSDQTVSGIHAEIDGIEAQCEIAELEQELSGRLKGKKKREVERRYTARLKRASNYIIPLENEIIRLYEQFLHFVAARRNPI